MRIKGLQAFLHAGVVDAQELVLGGSHVNEIWLAFCTFLIEELVDRLICWRLFQVSTDDLIERFAQMRRASFCSRNAFGAVLSGLVYSRINTCKAHNGAAARKTTHITDLGHELRGSCFTNAVHGAHSFVFRELGRDSRHLRPQCRQCHFARKKLLCCCGNE